MSTVELIDDSVFDKPFEILDLSLFEQGYYLIMEHPIKASIFLLITLILFIIFEFLDNRPQP